MAQRAVAGTSAAVASGLPGATTPPGIGAVGGGEPLTVEMQNVQRNYATISTSTRPSRTLLIHSQEMDATTVANAEEDLAIMARILDKAARSNPDDVRRFASGIEVDGAVFGSSSGSRNIILEGYGALFMLSVRYPLIAPPDKPEEPKTKDTSSDDWKRAREEILSSGGRGELWIDSNTLHGSRGVAEEFDADKVEQLKAGILEALKNATHIRGLAPDQHITVVVQGAEVGRTETIRDVAKPARNPNNKERETGRAGSAYAATGYIRKVNGLGQSVMTIRVKKSDADAFAKDQMTADEFRKKAAILSYYRKPEASNSAGNFMQIVR
jgi:hypothetical protein